MQIIPHTNVCPYVHAETHMHAHTFVLKAVVLMDSAFFILTIYKVSHMIYNWLPSSDKIWTMRYYYHYICKFKFEQFVKIHFFSSHIDKFLGFCYFLLYFEI